MSLANPPNYIEGPNPFKLAGPPLYWRQALWAFDASLVLIPSQQGFYYRLAQRRPPSLPAHIVNDALFKESDTKMLASHGLIPVTTVLATANWANYPAHFEAMRQRAPWRNGGAEKAIAEVEAREAQEELDKRNQTDEHLSYLGRDGWNLYNKKIGLRSHMYSPTTNKKPAELKRGEQQTASGVVIPVGFVS